MASFILLLKTYIIFGLKINIFNYHIFQTNIRKNQAIVCYLVKSNINKIQCQITVKRAINKSQKKTKIFVVNIYIK